jgi:hypothetical protein
MTYCAQRRNLLHHHNQHQHQHICASQTKNNQPSEEDGMQQVQDLAKMQRKISNNKQTRQRGEQRRQSQVTTLPQQFLEEDTGWLSYQGHRHPLLGGSQQEHEQRSQQEGGGGNP